MLKVYDGTRWDGSYAWAMAMPLPAQLYRGRDLNLLLGRYLATSTQPSAGRDGIRPMTPLPPSESAANIGQLAKQLALVCLNELRLLALRLTCAMPDPEASARYRRLTSGGDTGVVNA